MFEQGRTSTVWYDIRAITAPIVTANIPLLQDLMQRRRYVHVYQSYDDYFHGVGYGLVLMVFVGYGRV